MGSITHTKVTGAPADSTAIVDGPAWDADHTFSLTSSDVGLGNVPNVDATNAANITGTFGGITIAPTASTNNKGITLTQSTLNSGSVAGPISLNQITVTDNAQTVTGGFPLDSWGQITNQTSVWRLNYQVTGGAGNHFGSNVAVNVTGSTAGVAGVLATVGSDVSTTGNQWINIAGGHVGPGASLTGSLIGYEAELLIAATGSVTNRIAFSAGSQGPTQGSGIDAGFVFSTFNLGVTNYLTAAPFKDGFLFSNTLYGSGTFPISSTGNIMRADTGTVANVLEIPNLTVTGAIIDAQNVQLLGRGRLSLSNVVDAAAFSVNANAGVTTATFTVDTSLGHGNGVYIASQAAGSDAIITTISTNANENLQIRAKGSGIVDVGNTSTGGVRLAQGGGVVTLAQGQLAFPATQNPSAGANTLDDYEEGTWTPALTFATPGNLSVAYTLQNARYVKVGGIVHANFVILTSTFTFTTASGNLLLTGLPFTSLNASANDRWYSPVAFQGITKAGFTAFVGALLPNVTQLQIIGSGSGVAATNVTATDTPTGGTVIIAGIISYEST
ncbi:MAG TPA: hypothetical protein VJ846_10860 [Sphingomicrobium sp.]|nr:hypothetical protein [Sphingomicrobium sp.]